MLVFYGMHFLCFFFFFGEAAPFYLITGLPTLRRQGRGGRNRTLIAPRFNKQSIRRRGNERRRGEHLCARGDVYGLASNAEKVRRYRAWPMERLKRALARRRMAHIAGRDSHEIRKWRTRALRNLFDMKCGRSLFTACLYELV